MTASSTPRRAAFAFIFITVALDMLALGVVVPVLPRLFLNFTSDAAHAATLVGASMTLWAAMQFVSMPVVGALSDHFGRRPVILSSNLGMGLDYVLMAVAPTVGWLFLGRAISGITSASISTAYAYIADVTPPEGRAKRFGLLGAAFGMGFVVGPAVGGMLGAIDLRLPFWVAGALSLMNFAYGLFVLPESLSADKRAPFAWRAANSLGALKLLAGNRVLLGLGAAGFLTYLAHESLPSIFVLYADQRFRWDEATTGLALAAIGICSAFVSAVLIGRAVKSLGERRTMALGYGLGAIGFLFYALAPSSGWFVAGIPFVALWALGGPAMQALASAQLGPDAQGKLQGAMGAIKGITGMIGPLVFTQSFAAVTGSPVLAGLPYLIAFVLVAGALAVAWRATR